MAFAVSFRPLLLAVLLTTVAAAASMSVSAFTVPLYNTHPCNVASLTMSIKPPSSSSSSPRRRRWWTSRLGASPTSSSSTMIEKKQQILVKERARVSLDRETGKLTELRPAAPKATNSNNNINPWNIFKRTIYNTADAITTTTVRPNTTKQTPPKKTVDGYSSTLEQLPPSKSPGEQLMKVYQVRALETEKDEKKPTKLFHDIKEGLYNIAVITPTRNTSSPTSPVSVMKQSLKPVVQPTLASSQKVKEALSDLKSTSPGKKWLAELKIRNWDEGQRKQKRNYERQQAANAFKSAVYNVGDTVVGFVKALPEIPNRLSEVSKKVKTATTSTVQLVQSIPVAVEQTVETVTSIPKQVNQTVCQVQSKVGTSIETTKKAVEEIQALPNKIEQTVKETQRNVDETITNVKILVGVEKKKPAPPNVPPPSEPTAQELALKIASSVASVSVKAAWWVTISVARAGWAGTKWAFTKLLSDKVMEEQRSSSSSSIAMEAASSESKKSTTVQEPQMATASLKTTMEIPSKQGIPSSPKTTTTTTTNNVGSKEESKYTTKEPTVVKEEVPTKPDADTDMEALDKEVSDALLLAEKAMKMADEGKPTNGGMSELDAALQRAREAAVKATQEAVEIERNLNKK